MSSRPCIFFLVHVPSCSVSVGNMVKGSLELKAESGDAKRARGSWGPTRDMYMSPNAERAFVETKFGHLFPPSSSRRYRPGEMRVGSSGSLVSCIRSDPYDSIYTFSSSAHRASISHPPDSPPHPAYGLLPLPHPTPNIIQHLPLSQSSHTFQLLRNLSIRIRPLPIDSALFDQDHGRRTVPGFE